MSNQVVMSGIYFDLFVDFMSDDTRWGFGETMAVCRQMSQSQICSLFPSGRRRGHRLPR